MQKILLTLGALFLFGTGFSQNINDNKFTFQYVQLPLIRIDDRFANYEIKVEHAYTAANNDSSAVFEMRQNTARMIYDQLLTNYHMQKDSLDRLHLNNMANWEKSVNSGSTNPDGTQLAQPIPPVYPQPPVLMDVEEPFMHSALDEATVSGSVAIEGYTPGMGGFIVTITVNPIQIQAPVETKKGTGVNTKYEYRVPYSLPIGIKVESPTQGVLLEETLFQNMRQYSLPTRKSKYEHELYMLDNKDEMYRQIETTARNQSFASLSEYLNNQVGYVMKTRVAEMYSVKRFKDYEYSDVTNAYTLATQALSLVKNDRDRSGAMDKIDDALGAIEAILAESNINDKKARINDKITAMLQCNKAELLMWRAEFDAVDMMVNIILNSGEGKAKRHIQRTQGFYADQKKRWQANY